MPTETRSTGDMSVAKMRVRLDLLLTLSSGSRATALFIGSQGNQALGSQRL
jgi:hypothetical protein